MSEPLLSIVIPARNEERRLGATLDCARSAAAGAGLSDYEIIVADDDSTDGTVELARGRGAKVVRSGRHNIGATRNVGAAQARGRYILFLDADTHVGAATLSAMLKALEEGAVGGGALLRWIEPSGPVLKIAITVWNTLSRARRMLAGGFIYVRRDVFEKVGGFDESYLVAEELVLTARLKKEGRLVILKQKAATSAYKMQHFTPWELLRFSLRGLLSPRRVLKDKKLLAFWYDRRG